MRRAPTMSAAIGRRFFLLVYPRIGSRRSLVHWMKHHVSGRPHDVGIRPFCSHFLCGNASPCRPVPPLSHKSRAFVGALRMSVLKYGFHRALTALEHALFCSVFVGATLRGRPLMRKISFQCRSRHHVSLDKLKENRYNKSR